MNKEKLISLINDVTNDDYLFMTDIQYFSEDTLNDVFNIINNKLEPEDFQKIFDKYFGKPLPELNEKLIHAAYKTPYEIPAGIPLDDAFIVHHNAALVGYSMINSNICPQDIAEKVWIIMDGFYNNHESVKELLKRKQTISNETADKVVKWCGNLFSVTTIKDLYNSNESNAEIIVQKFSENKGKPYVTYSKDEEFLFKFLSDNADDEKCISYILNNNNLSEEKRDYIFDNYDYDYENLKSFTPHMCNVLCDLAWETLFELEYKRKYENGVIGYYNGGKEVNDIMSLIDKMISSKQMTEARQIDLAQRLVSECNRKKDYFTANLCERTTSPKVLEIMSKLKNVNKDYVYNNINCPPDIVQNRITAILKEFKKREKNGGYPSPKHRTLLNNFIQKFELPVDTYRELIKYCSPSVFLKSDVVPISVKNLFCNRNVELPDGSKKNVFDYDLIHAKMIQEFHKENIPTKHANHIYKVITLQKQNDITNFRFGGYERKLYKIDDDIEVSKKCIVILKDIAEQINPQDYIKKQIKNCIGYMEAYIDGEINFKDAPIKKLSPMEVDSELKDLFFKIRYAGDLSKRIKILIDNEDYIQDLCDAKKEFLKEENKDKETSDELTY